MATILPQQKDQKEVLIETLWYVRPEWERGRGEYIISVERENRRTKKERKMKGIPRQARAIFESRSLHLELNTFKTLLRDVTAS